LGSYLRAYQDTLTQQVSLTQAIVDLLGRQVGPALEVVDRVYVTDRPPSPPAPSAAPVVVDRINTAISQKKPGAVVHYNLTTNAAISKTAQQTFQSPPQWIIIDNIDQTNAIKVSFDGQKTFKTILKNSALNLPPWTIPDKTSSFDPNFWYKSDAAASVAFEVLSGE
jgi:hypothetical protein